MGKNIILSGKKTPEVTIPFQTFLDEKVTFTIRKGLVMVTFASPLLSINGAIPNTHVQLYSKGQILCSANLSSASISFRICLSVYWFTGRVNLV